MKLRKQLQEVKDMSRVEALIDDSRRKSIPGGLYFEIEYIDDTYDEGIARGSLSRDPNNSEVIIFQNQDLEEIARSLREEDFALGGVYVATRQAVS